MTTRRTRIVAALRTRPATALGFFAAFNLFFVGVDIIIAHWRSGFATVGEWIPLVYSFTFGLLAVVVAVSWSPAVRRIRERSMRVAFVVGGVVGLAGFAFHVERAFTHSSVSHLMAYSAPLLSPLYYSLFAGMGWLALNDERESRRAHRVGVWLCVAASFLITTIIAQTDHRANGYASSWEWAPLIPGVWATCFCVVMALRRDRPRVALVASALTFGVCAIVAIIGAVFHTEAVIAHLGENGWDSVIFGAPVFAPMLFIDVALFGVLALNMDFGPATRAASASAAESSDDRDVSRPRAANPSQK